MIRLIKRYGSRKLYDTEESRYVSLEELAGWIRHGQEIRVIDNKSGDDVTPQTLTQIISEEGRRGISMLPNELLHELIRIGEEAVSSGVEHVQNGVDRLMRASIDRLVPVRRAREEMSRLQHRLAELEASLADLEQQRMEEETRRAAPRKARPAAAARSGAQGGARKSTAAKKRSGAKPAGQSSAAGGPKTGKA
jgi:polyhydroxyalkanoate synthesis repressor PhaR